MLSSAIKTEFTHTTDIAPTIQTDTPYIFAIMLFDRRIVIGMSTNAPKRVANINGGFYPHIGGSLCVRRIIGIKPVTETRTLPSVVAQFCRDFGEERVVCI